MQGKMKFYILQNIFKIKFAILTCETMLIIHWRLKIYIITVIGYNY